MLAVHQVFRTACGSAVPRPPSDSAADDDPAQVELIRSYLDNVLRFLEVHHEGEDELLFPILLERDPDDAARIAEIAGQHTEVIAALADAHRAVDAFGATPGGETRQAAASALTALGAGLVPHLDDEESVIVPLAAQYMTMEEWGPCRPTAWATSRATRSG